jgi:hypothetical protein
MYISVGQTIYPKKEPKDCIENKIDSINKLAA